MLVLYGSHGSPGATTTAFLVASYWASRNDVQKCLLIEADPLGGVLAGLLNLKIEDGLSPFLLSHQSANLWDYTEGIGDSRESKLHILDIPHSLRGAWETSDQFSLTVEQHLEKFDETLPVVIDAGRLFYKNPTLELMNAPKAHPMLVIGEGNAAAITSAAFFQDAASLRKKTGALLSVGSPIWEPEEYKKVTGLELAGWVDEHPYGFVDLYEINSPPKARRTRQFYLGAQYLADQLYERVYLDTPQEDIPEGIQAGQEEGIPVVGPPIS